MASFGDKAQLALDITDWLKASRPTKPAYVVKGSPLITIGLIGAFAVAVYFGMKWLERRTKAT